MEVPHQKLKKKFLMHCFNHSLAYSMAPKCKTRGHIVMTQCSVSQDVCGSWRKDCGRKHTEPEACMGKTHFSSIMAINPISIPSLLSRICGLEPEICNHKYSKLSLLWSWQKEIALIRISKCVGPKSASGL